VPCAGLNRCANMENVLIAKTPAIPRKVSFKFTNTRVVYEITAVYLETNRFPQAHYMQHVGSWTCRTIIHTWCYTTYQKYILIFTIFFLVVKQCHFREWVNQPVQYKSDCSIKVPTAAIKAIAVAVMLLVVVAVVVSRPYVL